MASPKLPAAQALALTDPHTVQEVFVNSVAGIQIRDGIAHLTFAVIRPRHDTVNGVSQDEQVVAARIAMPVHTAASIGAGLNQLQTAMAMQSSAKPN